MILLTATGLSRQFDAEPVFRDVSFDVRPGEKIALVGPNGTGKTTLLRILAKLDEPDTGTVEIHGSTDVALLEQHPEFAADRTLLDEAKSGLAHLYELQAAAARLADELAQTQGAAALEKLQRRYDQIQNELARLDAYHIDHRVEEVLTGLGFAPDEYHRPLSQFSGGQRNRAVLARLLLRAPGIMLLDEPTNHLDIDATEWLENYLATSAQTLILVSHDRYFLDRVATRVLELNSGRMTDYKGNFSAYWTQREERGKVLERTVEKQQEEIARMEEFVRRNKYGQKHAQAADREKKLARIEVVELQQDFSKPNMHFGEATRTGDWVIDAQDVSKGFGTPLFQHFTLRILRGERVGILGPNGSGKTTLLRTILNELPPDTGKIRLGTGVKIGYYDQQLTSVDPERDAIDAVRPDDDPAASPGSMRSLLARFGIRGELALQKVGQMSGGERSKVALARVAASKVNVLVLDEPTNHLDLWARDSLESALKEFEGTILFVSHDRYFVDQVASSVIVFEADGWHYYEGNYSRFVEFKRNIAAELQAEAQRSNRQAEQKAAAASDRTDQPAKRKRKYPYRKVEDIEREIAATETLIGQLENDMANPDIHRDGNRVRHIAQQYEEAKQRLEELFLHWEEATELN